jgi:hypothetical protein
MNKEQLLETLKGLTTALEAATPSTSASSEDLFNAFFAGCHYVLDDLIRADSESKEICWSISPEDGSEEYGNCHVTFDVYKSFMKYVGQWDDSVEVKNEKYVEGIAKKHIAKLLRGIGLDFPDPTNTETTNPETPTA